MNYKSLYFAGTSDRKGKRRPASLFIPTLYFAEGLPYVLVNLVTVVMYSKLGISNELIGLYTSLLMWPWVIKMLLGPIVDRYSSKRTWLLGTQIICCILFAAIAFVLETHL